MGSRLNKYKHGGSKDLFSFIKNRILIIKRKNKHET